MLNDRFQMKNKKYKIRYGNPSMIRFRNACNGENSWTVPISIRISKWVHTQYEQIDNIISGVILKLFKCQHRKYHITIEQKYNNQKLIICNHFTFCYKFDEGKISTSYDLFLHLSVLYFLNHLLQHCPRYFQL